MTQNQNKEKTILHVRAGTKRGRRLMGKPRLSAEESIDPNLVTKENHDVCDQRTHHRTGALQEESGQMVATGGTKYNSSKPACSGEHEGSPRLSVMLQIAAVLSPKAESFRHIRQSRLCSPPGNIETNLSPVIGGGKPKFRKLGISYLQVYERTSMRPRPSALKQTFPLLGGGKPKIKKSNQNIGRLYWLWHWVVNLPFRLRHINLWK